MLYTLYKKIKASPTGVLLALSIGILLCLLIMCVISYQSIIATENVIKLRQKAYEVILKTENIFSSLESAESAKRAYIITKEPYYLNVFHSEFNEITTNFNNLHALLNGVHISQANLDDLNKLIQIRHSQMNHVIEIYQNKDMEAVKFLLKNGYGRNTLSRIKNKISIIRHYQRAYLNKKSEDIAVNLNTALFIVLASMLLAVLFLISSYFVVNRQMKERIAAQKELADTNNNLEKLVLERSYSLQYHLEFIRDLTNSLPQGIFCIDLEGFVTFANNACFSLLGFNQDELLGKKYNDILKVDNSLSSNNKALVNPISQVLSTKEDISPTEYIFTCKEGTKLPVLLIATPLLKDNEFSGVIVSFMDLTDRKSLESQFSTLSNAIPQLAWMADKDGYIFWYNQRWYDYTGTTLEDMQGWGWQTVHHPDEVERVVEKLSHSFKTQEPWEDTFPLRSKTGEYRWFLSRALPVYDLNNKLTFWFGTNTDITEIREAQQVLARTHEELEQLVNERTIQLQSVNSELEAFSYSISHDLRAPLRSITGFSQALVRLKKEQLDEEAQDYLQRIEANASKMGQLIDDILQLSRVTRGEMIKTSIDISVIAQEMLSNLSFLEPQRQLKLDIQPNLVVEGDKALIHVMLQNLIENAWKFTSKNKMTQIQIGMKQAENKDIYYIKDNGVGFNMEYVHKLFGVFQRLHTIDEFPGTGVGLATVQRIINRHGGSIWVESEPNKGTTFYFVLQ